MSISDLDTIMGRIAGAPKKSPIAVFDIGSSKLANAMFADTLFVKKNMNDPDLIGIFHSRMDKGDVLRCIHERLFR